MQERYLQGKCGWIYRLLDPKTIRLQDDSLEQKGFEVIEFSGKDKDWKIWSRKFLAQANRKGYKKLLSGATAIPTESEYTAAAGGSTDAEKLTVKLW